MSMNVRPVERPAESTTVPAATPWHKASYERLFQERLPLLLQERLPLFAYQAEPTGAHTLRVRVALAVDGDEIELTYDDLPQPDEAGVFHLAGGPHVVPPIASQPELDRATIRCVGERLYAYVEERLGQAPPGLAWDVDLARAWLPLDDWVGEFLRENAQRLDTTNWLGRHTHLRRLFIADGGSREPSILYAIAPGQMGRACPFETAEGPNMGRVLTIAAGAEVRGERLVVVDDRPAAALGLSASAIPLLEHNDANRLLMGANMLRQWVEQPDPEPALVQTGLEPEAPEFWTGRNLLTAYVSWGAEAYADGIVVSESCARRFAAPYALEAGDKLSNRHGTKGVVSRVLPDDEMPHLADGTPVEVAYSFAGLHVRMSFGQVREALLGRIARDAGEPIVVPPFAAPGEAELRAMLDRSGLPEMETLTRGRKGPPLERPSTVGWVYWGRLLHLARDKVRVYVGGEGLPSFGAGQMRGVMEHDALLEVGAHDNLREGLNTAASRREDAGTLSARLARGAIEPAGPPSPMFAELAARLHVAGIQASLEDGELRFDFQSPPPCPPCLRGENSSSSSSIELARPVPHPWLRERSLTHIGAYGALEQHDARWPHWFTLPLALHGEREELPSEAYAALIEANDRLSRLLASEGPEALVGDAQARLEDRVRAFFDLLLTPRHLRFHERMLFSGRTVIAPGADLRVDQVALADEIAWTLFGPLAARELGDAEAVRARNGRAAQALDEVMARSWVIVNRAPTLTPTAHLAFHPVRDPGSVVRLHPLACPLLDADYDGDQVAVFLPLTEGAQREAGERLSIAAHLARDPGLVERLVPPPEALWGLAHLGLADEGRREIAELAGLDVEAFRGTLTEAALVKAMAALLGRDGADAALDALDRLIRRGFEVARDSGASMSPFIGSTLARPPLPAAVEAWDAYWEELAERIVAGADYQEPDLGPQRLAVHVRARGRRHLPALIGPLGPVEDAEGNTVVVRHSRVEGLAPEELYATAVGARVGLARYWQRWEELAEEAGQRRRPERFTVLARARRATRPGIVFARAAANGEVDPLIDVESRLLVGL